MSEREERQGVFRGHLEALKGMGVNEVSFRCRFDALPEEMWMAQAWQSEFASPATTTAPSGEAALALLVSRVRGRVGG